MLIDEILVDLDSRVTSEMNVKLNAPYSKVKIEITIK